MDIVNDLFRYNNVFIKYMDQVNLYEDDFRMLDRYRAYLEIIKEFNMEGLFNEPRTRMILRKSIGISDDLFKESGSPIVDALKNNVINEYLKNKGM